jgi:phosphopantetheinyl transferase (holo-ACP synthase)
LILHGRAAARAAELGLTDFSVSLTHSRTDAMAFVVGFRADVGPPPVSQGTVEQ